ncbi:MAG: hypothetical protein Q9218_005063 [Villophora microphyllina]
MASAIFFLDLKGKLCPRAKANKWDPNRPSSPATTAATSPCPPSKNSPSSSPKPKKNPPPSRPVSPTKA